MQLLKIWLASNRAKMLFAGAALAFCKAVFPAYTPDEQTLMGLYGIIAAAILGDTFRPIDPNKAPA